MKRGFFILGTRPEAIKLLPVIEAYERGGGQAAILDTHQHGRLLSGVLRAAGRRPDYRLRRTEGTLVERKCAMLRGIEGVLAEEQAAFLCVQGDTLSAVAGAEVGFFSSLPVCHVEAGMRTYDKSNPFPEEGFRRAIAGMADLHFCPTEREAGYLIREGVGARHIYVTGNPFVDYYARLPQAARAEKTVLITLHRRENEGAYPRIMAALRCAAARLPDYRFLFPVHPTPALRVATAALAGIENVILMPPLSPAKFRRLLLSCTLAVTDSGGVQEECLVLAKRVLVLRAVSERPTDYDFIERIDPYRGNIEAAILSLLTRKTRDCPRDLYGTGHAGERIAAILLSLARRGLSRI